MKKTLLFTLIIPSLLASVSCGSSSKNTSTKDTSESSTILPKTISYDKLVYNLENKGFATGKDSPGQTHEIGVGGCDLGFPVHVKENNTIQFYFGDTFSSTTSQTGNWRSNVIGIANDNDDFENGLNLSEFILNDAGYTKYAINGHHDNNGANEVTKIPTGIVDVDGILYMFYFSMFDWNASQDTMMNYGGAIKSSDYGQTWERVYDLTWVNKESANSIYNIQGLINEDAKNTPGVGNINIEDHYGSDATQIFPLDGKDGYIYMFLEGGYRNRGLKLARVLKENIEVFEEYEYFTGKYDVEGNGIYKKGKNGLAYITNRDAANIVNTQFGEMSAFYNEYLKKWCVMTATGGNVMMYLADKIDGAYSTKCTLFPGSASEVIPVGSIYAPMSCEALQRENGKVMFMLCSTWLPFYNPSFIKVTFN